MSKITALFVVSAMVFAASAALAEVIDYDLSVATIPAGADGAVLFNRVDGNGYAFTQAHLGNGAVVDATITLTLVNYLGNPLANRPAEDFWLETSADGLVFPADGTIADGPTNASGQTQWQLPLNAGGCTIGETVIVMAEGQPLNQAGIDLRFVSPDINGDLVVNLVDLTPFSSAYTGTYSACSDMFFDGAINLTDLSLFAQAYGI